MTEPEDTRTPQEIKLGFAPYDKICRVCKEREVNHTKWICEECSYEALKTIKRGKEK